MDIQLPVVDQDHENAYDAMLETIRHGLEEHFTGIDFQSLVNMMRLTPNEIMVRLFVVGVIRSLRQEVVDGATAAVGDLDAEWAKLQAELAGGGENALGDLGGLKRKLLGSDWDRFLGEGGKDGQAEH